MPPPREILGSQNAQLNAARDQQERLKFVLHLAPCKLVEADLVVAEQSCFLSGALQQLYSELQAKLMTHDATPINVAQIHAKFWTVISAMHLAEWQTF